MELRHRLGVSLVLSGVLAWLAALINHATIRDEIPLRHGVVMVGSSVTWLLFVLGVLLLLNGAVLLTHTSGVREDSPVDGERTV